MYIYVILEIILCFISCITTGIIRTTVCNICWGLVVGHIVYLFILCENKIGIPNNRDTRNEGK